MFGTKIEFFWRTFINNINAQLINWNTVLSNKNINNDILVTSKAISMMATTIKYCDIDI